METVNLFIVFYISIAITVLVFCQYHIDGKKLKDLQHSATFAYQRAIITSDNPKYAFNAYNAKIIERTETGGYRNVPLDVRIISQNAEEEVFLFVWNSDTPKSAFVKHLFTPC
jgi:hypothetical protein